MSTILVVDDRPKEREKIVQLTAHCLPDGSNWDAVGIDPFIDIQDYPSFIVEKDIAVLVLDEKLQEQAADSTGEAVQYNGHELVEFIRPRFPELPIFVVTAFDNEEDLQNAAPEVEGIIPRMEFAKSPELHVSRMLRSGQRFSNALENDLATLSDLSRSVALGSATNNDIKRMNSIREKLSLGFPAPDLTQAKDLIPKAEQLITEAQSLLESIRNNKKPK